MGGEQLVFVVCRECGRVLYRDHDDLCATCARGDAYAVRPGRGLRKRARNAVKGRLSLAATNAQVLRHCGPRFAGRSLALQRLSTRSFNGWKSMRLHRWWEYPWTIDKVREHVASGTVADFGAGMSPIPIRLAELGYQAVVVDPDAEKLIGRKEGNEWDHVDYAQWGVPTHTAGIEAEVFAAGELDAAVSVSVIEHVPAEIRRQGIARVAEALRPGGVFVVTLDLEPDRSRLYNRVVEDTVEADEAHGTMGDLIAEAQQNGLELVDESWCPYELAEPAVGLVFRRT